MLSAESMSFLDNSHLAGSRVLMATSPKTSGRPRGGNDRCNRRFRAYDQNFDITASRIAAPKTNLGDSMLAYSQRMKVIKDFRLDIGRSNRTSASTVRPRDMSCLTKNKNRSNILQKSLILPKPVSLSHLNKSVYFEDADLPRRDETDDLLTTSNLARSHTIPPLRQHKRSKRVKQKEVKLHCASASDLCEIILPNKILNPLSPSKALDAWAEHAASQLDADTAEQSKSKLNATSLSEKLSEVDSDGKQIGSLSDSDHLERGSESRNGVTISKSKLKLSTQKLLQDAIEKLGDLESRKPNPLIHLPRLKKNKRMKLHQSMLGVIPEDETEVVTQIQLKNRPRYNKQNLSFNKTTSSKTIRSSLPSLPSVPEDDHLTDASKMGPKKDSLEKSNLIPEQNLNDSSVDCKQHTKKKRRSKLALPKLSETLAPCDYYKTKPIHSGPNQGYNFPHKIRFLKDF